VEGCGKDHRPLTVLLAPTSRPLPSFFLLLQPKRSKHCRTDPTLVDEVLEEEDGLGLTPLICAVQVGEVSILLMLLRFGADANKPRSDNGVTALMTASVYTAQCDRRIGIRMMEYLLQGGASPDSRTFGSIKEGITPLMFMATSDLLACQTLVSGRTFGKQGSPRNRFCLLLLLSLCFSHEICAA
jgi:ankyrin repeat protein